MSSILEIKNFSFSFISGKDRNRAVKNISFGLKPGETLGIVGESGSGKSVTSLSILELIQTPPGSVDGGEINYFTKEGEQINLLSLSNSELRKYRGKEIAMIFQEPMTSLNPVFTCGFQVVEAIRTHENLSYKEARQKTIQLFEKVKLPDPERIFISYPHQLSGGQKQRVMIAMAISCKPSVLIADEPTTALDVTIQKTILSLLKELQLEYGMGLIFITHDLGVIADIADRVAVMYKGKIVEEGSVSTIFNNSKSPYTRGLLLCRPPLEYRLKKLPTVSDFMEVDKEGNIREKIDSAQNIEYITQDERSARHSKLYNQEPILKVKNLNTWFSVSKGILGLKKDFIKAVNDVSFNVYPGETLGLVGESGCGKTTLGRTILQLIKPTSGDVVFENKNLTQLSRKELRNIRKEIQIIFQDPYSSLNPRMTIGKAIEEPMRVHRLYPLNQCKSKTIELLEKVGLDAEHYNRFPHQFSGGQRQRIVIARALALNPKFIICDESVSALDVSVQAQVLNLLNQLKIDFGFTYIFISHDLSVVKFMADRMIVMNKGKIEEIGDPDEIYKNPKSDYTRRLIDAIPKGL